MPDDFPKFIQPESIESEFKHIFFFAPKPMMFYSNHNTFCQEVMKIWTRNGSCGYEEGGKNPKVFENKEEIKIKKIPKLIPKFLV